MSLTKQDIKAMKSANYVYFGYRKPGYGNEARPEGFYASATLEGRQSSTGYDQDHVFSIDGRIHTYGYPGNRAIDSADIVAAGEACRQFDGEFRTVLDLLREGDELIVHFQVGNDSESMRNAGVTADELRLEVVRPTASGHARRLYFNLSYRVVPVTSTARMITLPLSALAVS